MLLTVIQASLRKRVLVEAPTVAADVPVLYLPSPCLSQGQVMDFDSSAQLMAEAERLTRDFLAICATPRPGQMGGEPHFHREQLVCHMVDEPR